MRAPSFDHVFNLTVYGSPVGFPMEVHHNSNLHVVGVVGGTLSTVDNKSTFPVLNAADWMTVEPSGAVANVNVRLNAQGLKGGLDLKYHGKLHFSPELLEVMQGKRSETKFGEAYFYTSPQISSRSEDFEWVNNFVFLGQGLVGIRPDGKFEIRYRIFKVE